jgi:subtilase family serine protease
LEIQFKCDNNNHNLTFIVDTTNAVTEFSETNNKAYLRLECRKHLGSGAFTPAK